MRRLPLVLVVSAALLALAATPAFAADKDCPDFRYQEDAQAYFTSHGGSPSNNFDRLDADHNGVACEDLPHRPASSPTPVASSAPSQQAATESLPRTGASGTLAPLGIALVLIGGVAVLASRRRRRALR